MGSVNLCPFCGAKMKSGVIHGDRYRLKWIPKENDKGIILQWFSKGIKFGYSLESSYCEECKKIIIDVESNAN
jgi:hypothetical protein